jgi:uncharacterized protein
MPFSDPADETVFNKTEQSAYSYVCNGCNKCCVNKGIRVGPYEVLRLSRNLGVSTTEFIAQHTKSGGTILKATENGACVFLTGKGCGVHSDRPLVCRLYPLGMEVLEKDELAFGDLEPHPDSAGVTGTAGTVADYLANQGVAPFIEANKAYDELYITMVDALEKIDCEELFLRQERRDVIDDMPSGTLASDWMDVDAMLAKKNSKADRSLSNLEQLVKDHIQVIQALLPEI